LKKNGTLWRWGKLVTAGIGSAPYRSTVFNLVDPERFGEDTNWTKIVPGNPVYLEKKDGSRWRMEEVSEHGRVSQYLVPVHGKYSDDWGPEVKADGTLWFYAYLQLEPGLHPITRYMVAHLVTVQLGSDAKWKSASFDGEWPPQIIALRNDRTLWKWEYSPRNDFNIARTQPTQLGSYTNWIALLSLNGYSVALAADGSLWAWDKPRENRLLAPSREPEFIANIFEGDSGNR
jgi:hypothetical protein